MKQKGRPGTVIMNNLLKYLILIIVAVIPFGIEKKITLLNTEIWITLSDVLMLIALLLWIYHKIKTNTIKTTTTAPLFNLFALLTLTFLLSFVNSLSGYLVAKELIKLIVIIGFYLLLVENVTDKTLNAILNIICLTSFIITAWFLIDFLGGRVEQGWPRLWLRGLGSYVHLNSLGIFLTITIPINLSRYFNSKENFLKFAFVISALMQFVALYLTFSRGAWIGIIIALTVLAVFKYRLKGILGLLLIIFIAFGISALFMSPSRLSDRFISIFNPEDAAILSRTHHMLTAVKLIKSNPVFGVGLGNFQVAAKKYENQELTEIAHNVFLQYAAEAGVISAVLLLIIFIKHFLNAYIIYNTSKDIRTKSTLLYSVIGFLGLIIAVQFGDPFIRGIKEYFFIVLSIPYILAGDKE